MQTFIDRYIEEGERCGELNGIRLVDATMLLRQIELKFGALSGQERRRIESAVADTLLKWSGQLLIADSLVALR